MDEVSLGLIKVYSVFHQSLEQLVLLLIFSVSLSIYSFFDLRISLAFLDFLNLLNSRFLFLISFLIYVVSHGGSDGLQIIVWNVLFS